MTSQEMGNICNMTPVIRVMDNRGMPIRSLNYRRADASAVADELIEQSQFDLPGNLNSRVDPRFFSTGSHVCNFSNNHAHSGILIKSVSVDSGLSVALMDVEGRLVWGVDGNHVITETEYDLLGRATAVYITAEGEKTCKEYFVYGENEAGAQDNNLIGALVRYYDAAGLQSTSSLTIAGLPLTQTRQLLAAIDEPVNWRIDNESENADKISSTQYTTLWTYDLLGKVATQEDAKRNIRTTKYNVAGQQLSLDITMSGRPSQAILSNVEYAADGQNLVETYGNNITVAHNYEPQTMQVIQKQAVRSGDTPAIMMNMSYEYDSVGNLLNARNNLAETAIFKNQVVSPEFRYEYDTLYQLVSASGRESDALRAMRALPTAMPLDVNPCVNYSERYVYDYSGNLCQIKHLGAVQFSRDISISSLSNRGMLNESGTVQDVDGYFDSVGNQMELLAGSKLEWDSYNQLHSASIVVRENGENDAEYYFYNGNKQRMMKKALHKTSDSIRSNSAIYLPGLELRVKQNGDVVSESLQVISAGAGIRILHWENNTQPNGITNNQYRYCMQDTMGVLSLEMDQDGQIITREEYYPYGGTAVWAGKSEVEADYKTLRYSGKELDATGLYYYGYRYYMPWCGRWLSADPAGAVDGLNLYCMVRNNPVNYSDSNGLAAGDGIKNFRRIANRVRENVRSGMQEYNRRIDLITANFYAGTGERRDLRVHTYKTLAVTQFLGGTRRWKTGESTSSGNTHFWLGYIYGSKDQAQLKAKSQTRAGAPSGTIENTMGGYFLDNFVPFNILAADWHGLPSAEKQQAQSKFWDDAGSFYENKISEASERHQSLLSQRNNSAPDPAFDDVISGAQDTLEGLIRNRDSTIALLANPDYVPIGGAGAGYIWDFVSMQYAWNATNAWFTIPNRIEEEQPNKAWTRVERPILRAKGTPITYNHFENPDIA